MNEHSKLMTNILTHLNIAHEYAKLSKAKRLKVGAVVIKDGRIITVGYNGNVQGGSNVCEVEINGELVTKGEVLHAEENCIAFAAKNGIAVNGCTLVITHSPCFSCSRLIIQSGINSVYYENDYRDPTAVDFLKNHGVNIVKIKP